MTMQTNADIEHPTTTHECNPGEVKALICHHCECIKDWLVRPNYGRAAAAAIDEHTAHIQVLSRDLEDMLNAREDDETNNELPF